MTAVFTVKFRTESYIDFEEILTICASLNSSATTNATAKITLFVSRKTFQFSMHFDDNDSLTTIPTINCGTCFLGDNKTTLTKFLIHNVGNNSINAKFSLVTECEWWSKRIDCCRQNRCISIDGSSRLNYKSFSIWPTHFDCNFERKIIDIYTSFLPSQIGSYCEKFYVLCDNNCHREIEIVGNCVGFHLDDILVDVKSSEDDVLLEKLSGNPYCVVSLTLEPCVERVFTFIIQNQRLPINFTISKKYCVFIFNACDICSSASKILHRPLLDIDLF